MKPIIPSTVALFVALGINAGCGTDNALPPLEDATPSDAGVDSVAPHCTALGTWERNFDGNRTGYFGFESQGLGDIAEGVEVTITTVTGCAFEMALAGADHQVSCDIPNLSIPLNVGETYTLTSCGTPYMMSDPHDFFVLRDSTGQLVLAAGSGSDLIDVSCLPSELSVDKVHDDCPPLEGYTMCGPRINFGMRVTSPTETVDLWSGEVAELAIDSATYQIHDFYSFDAEYEPSICSEDYGQQMSWVIMRKTP